MFGGTLALLTRSMRVEVRLVRYHLFRMLFVGFIYFSVIWWQSMSAVFGAAGLRLFQSMSWLNFVFITLAGLSLFSSAVTEEKEEETLGLLKMAGIHPVSLLLGKSTSRLISVILLLSAQFPFTLLAITLGGVSLGQVVAVYWALLAYMVLVANMALLCSVVSRRTRTAAGLMFILLLMFYNVPPLVQAWCGWMQRGDGGEFWAAVAQFLLPAAEWLTDQSISIRIRAILGTGFSESAFSPQVISNFATAAGFFLLSWAAFDRFTRDQSPAAPSRGMLLKRSSRWKLYSAGRVWSRAMVWKDFHFVVGGRSLMLAKFIAYGLLLALIAVLMAQERNRSIKVIYWTELGDVTMIAALIAGGIELALIASRIFHDEIKGKTLSAVVMLPIPLHRLVYAKIGGCLLSLVPALLWFTLGAVLNPKSFFDGVGNIVTEPFAWVGLLYCMLFLHIVAVLSLFVKWGALPLAFVVMFFLQTCLSPFSIIGAAWGNWFSMGTVLVLLIVVIQFVIGRRLRTLAAR